MRRLVPLLVLVLLPLPAAFGQADETKGGLDAKDLAAWEKAGARFGWLAYDDNGPMFTVERPKDKRAVPAFQVNGQALQQLKDLPKPKVPFGLEMQNLVLSDAEMKLLAGFTTLQALDMNMAKFSDEGIKELSALPGLYALFLDSTPIGDAGVRSLAKLQTLRMLNLYQAKIGDASMKSLGELKQLTWLDLGDTKVTDLGLKELASLKRLQTLLLDGSKVTNTGVEELRKALPKCKIDN